MDLTKRQRERITQALRTLGETNFQCGEWDRNESDEPYDRVCARAERARTRVYKLLGLTEEAGGPDAHGA